MKEKRGLCGIRTMILNECGDRCCFDCDEENCPHCAQYYACKRKEECKYYEEKEE